MLNRAQFVRRTAATVAGVALAATGFGVAGALQANAAVTQPVAAPVAVKTITIKSDKATAKAWAKVSFSGKTTGIAKNTVVQVQRFENGKWVNFPATTKVTAKSTYSVWVQSGRVGVNKFRVLSAKTASAAVNVTITK
ncbi:hypothetical protein HPO96_06975 [Kribbella sandramycini]|uniref:Ig-like domain-containing protein n=1 Tax=Kribbella sandramycini TaxID=60450 RepID=A0A7Y4NXY8_9ACTN|nr:hypothetical protein [Kribbella sandramycini]MBB6567407.1 hypothetical protein [Kribbella sandramycini]NOL39981.1 hypothetical protein [Kribbella sandramycini]